MGPVPIRQPRVHDRREGKAFRSAILPRYMRRAPSIDARCWEQEYQAWRHRDLSDKHYVYVWADGIYFQVRLRRGSGDGGLGFWAALEEVIVLDFACLTLPALM